MTNTPTTNQGILTVSFPATSGFLRISRINATAFASDLGFDIESLDDLRLAVAEAVTWLVKDNVDEGSVVLTLSAIDRGIRLTAERTTAGLPDRPLDDLQHAILGATVDRYEITASEEGRRLVLEKQLP